MHPTIYREFHQVVSNLKLKGRVLEVGAVPSADSLLAMDELRGAERVGVNISGGFEFGGFKITQANGNDMSMFPTGHFNLVLSNATIEHDPFFWKTCAEMRRVLCVGGIAIIGAPGYTVECGLRNLGTQAPRTEDETRIWKESALTFRYHGAPLDYYRFSPDAFRDVIFEGYRDVVIKSVMAPPRIIGHGVKI
jgi:hypothetical protein